MQLIAKENHVYTYTSLVYKHIKLSINKSQEHKEKQKRNTIK